MTPAIQSPVLLITVDSELSNFPNGQGLWGRVGSEEWGLARLARAMNSIDVRGTFFLDVYGNDARSVGEQQRAAELIAGTNHDLQLHTHPGPAFDPNRPRLRDYTPSEQADIVAFGVERIQRWTGRRPVLHRAGDWGADSHSLAALRKHNFLADFSGSAWSVNCGFEATLVAGNGWRYIDGLLCGIGTCFRDRLTGRLRRIDLDGTSSSENSAILALKIDPLVLTLHSFSALTFNRARTKFRGYPQYIERLARFCETARREHGYRVLSAIDAATAIKANVEARLPWMELHTTGAAASFHGVVYSIGRRLGI